MPKEFARTHRLSQQLQREIAVLIQNEIKDPRINFITVQDVTVSKDLSIAKVYVSSLDTNETVEEGNETEEIISNETVEEEIEEIAEEGVEEIEEIAEEAIETEEEEVEDSVTEEPEPEPEFSVSSGGITGNLIRGITGLVIGDEVEDLEYANSITIYIEKDFTEKSLFSKLLKKYHLKK